MIYVQANTIRAAARQAFYDLYKGASENESDLSMWYEDTAALQALTVDSSSPGFSINDAGFCYVETYSNYVPTVHPSVIALEEKHYTTLLLTSGRVSAIVKHLSKYPDSRRALLSGWSPRFYTVNREAPCLTALYFRIRQGRLDVHAHARACNAYTLLLLDLQVVAAVQELVAHKLMVPTGIQTQYIDSLHFYRQDREAIIQQLTYMATTPAWA